MTHRLTALILSAALGTAQAVTINVNSTDGSLTADGNCSLPEAVVAANTNLAVDACPAGASGEDLIMVNQVGTITLASTLRVTEALEIQGGGRLLTRVSGNNQRQILVIDMVDPADEFSLSDMRLQNGRNTNTSADIGGGAVQLAQGNRFRFTDVNFDDNGEFDEGGAAIFAGPLDGNIGATLIVERGHFNNNITDGTGGAILSFDTATRNGLGAVIINQSEFNNNQSAFGGGAMTLSDVRTIDLRLNRFVGNVSTDSGGGAINVRSTTAQPANLIIERSSFSGNQAQLSGAGLFLSNTALLMYNTTLAGNVGVASNQGGAALTLNNGATASLQYVTMADNGQGRAGDSSLKLCIDCSADLRSTIVFTDSQQDDDCVVITAGTLTSQGANIDSDGSCTPSVDDLPMTDPELLPLDDYGSQGLSFFQLSMPPRSFSQAIDRGQLNTCPGPFGSPVTIDQRGQIRPVDGLDLGESRCDSGAIEFQPGLDLTEQLLMVNIAGTGSGRVTNSSAGLDCASDCSIRVEANTTFQLSAFADPGSRFVSWSGGGCAARGEADGECAVTMNGDQTRTAVFDLIVDELFEDGFE